MTWQESYDYAIAQGGRLASLTEGQLIINSLTVNTIGINGEWVAVGDPLNKDWMSTDDATKGNSYI